MTKTRIWHGVRMHKVSAGADADSPLLQVTLPAAWEDTAAEALVVLTQPTGRGVSLPDAATAWIRPIAHAAAKSAAPQDGLADRLHALLLHRRAAPTAPLWRGQATRPGFIINLAAFHDPALGFDLPGFVQAAGDVATALSLATAAQAFGSLGAGTVGLSGLSGLLAALGIAYDSPAARDVAACLAALLRARSDTAATRMAGGKPAAGRPSWPAPPAACAIPGLAEAARAAHADASTALALGAPAVAVLPPDAADALLGIETAGLAPAFSPLAAAGGLTRTARAWLDARGISTEAALAALLAGADPFPAAGAEAHRAMQQAVAPYLYAVPAAPAALPGAESDAMAPATRSRRDLPARHAGYTQKIALGGHRLFLRTGEYPDGTLGELTVTLPKDSATARGLMEALGQAVSLGLQHGVKLDEFIEIFADTRFGAAGTVEGDAAVSGATSPLDYVARHLAANYLGRHDLPLDEEALAAASPATAPTLPLDLPAAHPRAVGDQLATPRQGGGAPRPRRLRLVDK